MVLEYISGILKNFELNIRKTPAEVLPKWVMSASCAPDAVPLVSRARLAHRTLSFRSWYPSATCWFAEVSSGDRDSQSHVTRC